VSEYERTRRRRAITDTRQFWKILQTWKHFAAPVTGFVAGIIRMVWLQSKIGLDTLVSGLIWAICFYAVAWIGTFVVNYIWLSPSALGVEQRQRFESEIATTAQDHQAALNNLQGIYQVELANREQDNQELREQFAESERQLAEERTKPLIQGEAFNFRTEGERTVGYRSGSRKLRIDWRN
jgi:hypothetical protein